MRFVNQVCRLVFVRSFVFVLLAPFPGFAQKSASSPHVGLPQDWSNQHVVFSGSNSAKDRATLQSDPRLLYSWMQRTKAQEAKQLVGATRESVARPPLKKPKLKQHRDWSISLGDFPPATRRTFPAKFSFDINATPDCNNDFVVFPINATPSPTQANIAAFNNLYSGTPAGVCPGTTATPLWAYRVTGGPLATSPALSLDGTKVAFVLNSSPSIFVVLAWKAGDGSVGSPSPTISTVTAPQAGTGEAFLLPLAGGGNDTGSSPFIDFTNDTAYIGTDGGKLYRINNVFCSTPACIATPVAPSLAGGNWPVTVGTALSSSVHDQVTDSIFVGGADGKLYGFDSAGAALANPPVVIGAGTTNGGVRDGPIVDSFGGFVYAAAGANGTGNGVMVQIDTALTPGTKRTALVGQGGIRDIHLSTLNDAYFTQPTNTPGTTAWFLYVVGAGSIAPNPPTLFRIGFDAARVMNSAVDGTSVALSGNANEVSPLTNIVTNGVDRLFVGLGNDAVIKNYDISTTTTPTQINTPLSAAGGTSGIIIDNVRPEAQASSVYFTTMSPGTSCGTHICAVKATQNGLN